MHCSHYHNEYLTNLITDPLTASDSKTGKRVSNECCNCDPCWISLAIIGLLCLIVILGLAILIALLLTVLCTDPDSTRQGTGGQIRRDIQKKMVEYFKIKLPPFVPV